MEHLVSITATNKGKGKGKGCLLHAREAQRGGRGIAVPTFNLSARRRGWLTPHPGCSTPGRDLLPI
jgi:hypothetical protein